MAGGNYESGYWVVHSEGEDTPYKVEHVSTFEQAHARWKALGGDQTYGAEVYGPDGCVLLHRDMHRWQMSAPRAPGRYCWTEEQGYYSAHH